MMRRDLGIWDRDLYDYGALYDTTFDAGQGRRGSTTTRRR